MIPYPHVPADGRVTATEVRWYAQQLENPMSKEGLFVEMPTARKDDGGKIDMTLFDDMPRALKAVAEVMQWAITKKQPVPYVRGSWQAVEADRYRAAQGRHNLAQGEQMLASGGAARFQRDPETSLLHEAHKACSALMALENILRELEAAK